MFCVLFGSQSEIVMEVKFLSVFCALVAISSAKTTIQVEDGRDLDLLREEESFKIEPRIFEDKILEAIKKFKDILKNGDPSNGTPPLDPYFLSHKDFDFFIMDTELTGFFQNTTFANFSRFIPENIEFKLLPVHFKVDLFLDQFNVDGRYKLSGKILNDIPVNSSGKFISEVKNLTLSLYVKPTTVNSSFQIKDLIIEFKTVGVKIKYTNELADGKVHELDENLALYVLYQAQAKYVPPLLEMVKTVLNHFLLGYSYQEIIKIILDFLSKQ